MFFLSIANTLVDGGLGGALVRKQNSSDDDYATVFTLNLVVSVILYLIVFLLSDLIAKYYNDERLADLIRVSFVVIIFNAFSLTQNSRLAASMNFRRISICRVTATILSSTVALVMASVGFGVWSLVFMQLFYALINSVLLNTFNGFYFRLRLSMKSIKELYAFGINLSLSSLLTTAFDNIYQLILGKYFSINLTGLYYQGKKLQEVPINVINSSVLQGPVFSYLARKQQDLESLSLYYLKINRVLSLVAGFLTVFVFLFSDSIVNLVYGSKWEGSGYFMKLLSLSSFFFLMEMCNRVLFKVFDKTGLVLYLDLIKKCIQSVGIVIGIYYQSIDVLLIGFVVTSFIGYLINLRVSQRLLGEKSRDYFYFIKVLFVIVFTILGMYYMREIMFDGNGLSLRQIPIFILLYFFSCGVAGLFKGLELLSLLKQKNA